MLVHEILQKVGFNVKLSFLYIKLSFRQINTKFLYEKVNFMYKFRVFYVYKFKVDLPSDDSDEDVEELSSITMTSGA